MQDEVQHSFLIWDNVDNLPFPPEVKALTTKMKWDEYEWHTAGLPIPLAKYSMSDGKMLYLSELPNGNCKTERMTDFTGNIAIGGFFVNEEDSDGWNYFVTFIVTILKGDFVEAKILRIDKQPYQAYANACEEFKQSAERVARIVNAWWFKYLYRPWFMTIRFLGFIALCILKFISNTVIWTVRKLTPI